MRNLVVLCLCIPCLSWAGAYDYYECTGQDGKVNFSINRCEKGDVSRKINNDEAPVTVNLGRTSGSTVRLESGQGGHFYSTAIINGIPLRMIVDTGATHIALSPSAARRMNLDMQHSVRMRSQTANGVAQTQGIVLQSVELGGNTVRNLQGTVMTQDMGNHVDGLLGMNFLKYFEVNTDGMLMTLRPK